MTQSKDIGLQSQDSETDAGGLHIQGQPGHSKDPYGNKEIQAQKG